MSDGGNILRRVLGQYLGAALRTLPAASSSTEASMDATIDVPGIGIVRVTAKRMKSGKGRAVNYFWTPEKAAAVDK